MTRDETITTPYGELAIRQGQPADTDALTVIYDDVVEWQKAQGMPPGLPPLPMREIVARRIVRGVIYLASLDGAPAGTITLEEDDREVWPEAAVGEALYVHGLAVARAFAGKEIGLAMLAWAERVAANEGKSYVRLDCMADNPALRAYYVRAGYTDRGERALPRRIAARYEKRVGEGGRLWS